MRYLPVSIDTKGKNFLVIGAGDTAYEKVLRLMDSDGKIYIIGEEIIPELKELQIDNPDRIFIKEQRINKSFVFFAYDYVIIATDDLELNDVLELRARKSGISYMRCDGEYGSTFLIGDYVTNGDITVALYNELNNPPVEQKIADDLQELIDSYNMDKFKILSEIRKTLLRRNSPNVDAVIRELYDREKLSVDMYLRDLNAKAPTDTDYALVEDIVKENIKLEDVKKNGENSEEVSPFTKELIQINHKRQREENKIEREISDYSDKSAKKEEEGPEVKSVDPKNLESAEVENTKDIKEPTPVEAASEHEEKHEEAEQLKLSDFEEKPMEELPKAEDFFNLPSEEEKPVEEEKTSEEVIKLPEPDENLPAVEEENLPAVEAVVEAPETHAETNEPEVTEGEIISEDKEVTKPHKKINWNEPITKEEPVKPKEDTIIFNHKDLFDTSEIDRAIEEPKQERSFIDELEEKYRLEEILNSAKDEPDHFQSFEAPEVERVEHRETPRRKRKAAKKEGGFFKSIMKKTQEFFESDDDEDDE